jgi:hypothetical protein
MDTVAMEDAAEKLVVVDSLNVMLPMPRAVPNRSKKKGLTMCQMGVAMNVVLVKMAAGLATGLTMDD